MPHCTRQRRSKLTPAQKEAIYALPLSEQFFIVHIDGESGYVVYLGEPNYIQDQIHWFVKGKILKYNRSKKQ